jgi:hypothetical protein
MTEYTHVVYRIGTGTPEQIVAMNAGLARSFEQTRDTASERATSERAAQRIRAMALIRYAAAVAVQAAVWPGRFR